MKKTFLMTLALLCAVAQGAWAQTEVGTEAALTEVINGDGSNKAVKMTADITLGSRLNIVNGKNVTLDLNGHKLSRSLTEYADDGNVIRVETGGQLTVEDGSGNDSGQITGGKAINGGGICNHGTLTIEGGTITGCSASSNGGGIYNAPATADGYPTSLTIKGGTVTGNTCGDRGAGIFNYPGCVLNIQGTVDVSGNTKGSEANNVYLDGETVFTVTGALTGSHIGVSILQSGRTITSGYETNNSADGATFFSSDNEQYSIAQDGDELFFGRSATFNVRSWDDTNKQVVTTQVTKVSTPIEGNNPDGWMTLTNGYYVVTGNVEYQALTIVGSDVHLILADGCNLNCRHIKLEQGNSLYIYSESDGDNMGQLYAENNYYSDGASFNGAAGIGGGKNQNSGSLYVHGGYVRAKSYSFTSDGNGAGIGGGINHGIGGEVVIYGGKVEATGYAGAGIGGGYTGSQGGPVKIYGGDVSAEGIEGGAGIGGGNKHNGGSVYIYGGNVSAKGSNYYKDSGVGDGDRDNIEINSAGIGGGRLNYTGDLHIYGGTVMPSGGEAGRGKSQCVTGSVEIATGMRVTTKVGPVVAADRVKTCYIMGSDNDLTIFPCSHDDNFIYTFIDGTKHSRTCKYCGVTWEEDHTYDSDNPCACGQPHDATADLWSVTLHRASAAGSTSYVDRVAMMVVKGQTFTIPAVSATEGLTLMGYTTSWTEGDGIEMKDTEEMTLTKVGDVVTPTDNWSYYPRYRYRYVPTWTWTSTGTEDEPDATATLNIQCGDMSSIEVTNISYTTDGDVKTATATYVNNGATYTFTNAYTLPAVESSPLADDSGNEETIDDKSDRRVNTVTLSDRTLYKDGSWNTLCLPFGLGDFTGTPLEGATVKTLESSEFDGASGTLTLKFTSGSLAAISAGVPYIVKWALDTDITNPVFTDVTIRDGLSPVTTDYVDFSGSFSPVNLKANNRSVLYLGADNKLYYPSANMTVGSCRAVFRLKDITAGDLASGANARRFVLNFGDSDETTGIISIDNGQLIIDSSFAS